MSDNLHHQEEWAANNGVDAAVVKLNGGTNQEVKVAAENQLERCCDNRFTWERALKIARKNYTETIQRLTASAQRFGFVLGDTHLVRRHYNDEFSFVKIH